MEICLCLSTVEIQALKEIKAAWKIQEWKGNPDCRAWEYITCNNQGHVISLRFGMCGDGTRLKGRIPESVCKLSFMEKLQIYGHEISGSIPECIGGLQELTHLELTGNCLGGHIPETLGKLDKLIHLDLSVNNHSDAFARHCEQNVIPPYGGLIGPIPNSIGNLSSLRHLELSDNKLQGPIPDSLGQLRSLVYLDINSNNLSGAIPASIGSITSLESIRLNNNNLSGNIPESIGNLQALEVLSMTGNQLSGNIPEFNEDSLLNLKLIDLRNNNLTGSLPRSLRAAPLRYLLVSNNKHMSDRHRTPDYVKANWKERSVINLTHHFECPGFAMEPDFNHIGVGSSVVEMDPEYYSFELCYCTSGYFGIPPEDCRPCLTHGKCTGEVEAPQDMIPLEGDLMCKQNMKTKLFKPRSLLMYSAPSLQARPKLGVGMSFPRGFYPVYNDSNDTLLDTNNVVGLEECAWVNNTFSACNPYELCRFNQYELVGIKTGENCKLCAEGYLDRLCSRCDCSQHNNTNITTCYYKSNDECLLCDKASTTALVFIVAILIAVIAIYTFFEEYPVVRLFFVVLMGLLLLTLQVGSSFYLEILLLCIFLIPATTNGLNSGFMHSFIFYMQTLLAIGENILPFWLSQVYGRLEIINVKMVGLVCIFPDLLGRDKNAILYQYLVSLFAPVFVFLVVLVLLLLRGIFNKCRTGRFEIKSKIFFSLTYIAYFSYFNAATLVTSIFNCVKDSTGHSYLNIYPYVNCGSETWKLLLVTAVFGGIFLLVLPFTVFTILLYRNRDKLSNPHFQSWLGHLYMSYAPKCVKLTEFIESEPNSPTGFGSISSVNPSPSYDQSSNPINFGYTGIDPSSSLIGNTQNPDQVIDDEANEYNAIDNVSLSESQGLFENNPSVHILIKNGMAKLSGLWMYSEVFFMLLRFVLAASIAIPPNTIWRNMGILTVLLITLLIYLYIQPFTHSTENNMGYLSVMALIFTFFASIQINTRWNKPLSNSGDGVCWLLFVINTVMVLSYIIVTLWHGRKHLRKNVKTIKNGFRNITHKIRHWRRRNYELLQ